MTKYGKVIAEKNGFMLVPVEQVGADGSVTIVAYVIIDPAGNEIGRFDTLEDAQEALKELGDDDSPPSPPSPPLRP